jgi:hypothetical protein
VTNDIKRELEAGRAILVVFKDQIKLEKFAKEIKMTGLEVISLHRFMRFQRYMSCMCHEKVKKEKPPIQC